MSCHIPKTTDSNTLETVLVLQLPLLQKDAKELCLLLCSIVMVVRQKVLLVQVRLKPQRIWPELLQNFALYKMFQLQSNMRVFYAFSKEYVAQDPGLFSTNSTEWNQKFCLSFLKSSLTYRILFGKKQHLCILMKTRSILTLTVLYL